MQLTEILSELEYHNTKFPRLALERAIQAREAITPLFLEKLAEYSQDLQFLLHNRDFMLHIYVMMLLAQFKEAKAYPLIIQFFSHPGNTPLDVTEDLVTEYLARILASVSYENIAPIQQIIENKEINEFIRGAAIKSLVILVAQGIISRKQVIQYYEELFLDKLQTSSDCYTWTDLIMSSAVLCPIELQQYIDKAYKEDKVDICSINESKVADFLEMGIESALEKLRNHHYHQEYSFIEDTISELEHWNCFLAQKNIESMEATQTVETVELTQIVEITDVIESMEATPIIETVELTQIVEITDVIESMEATPIIESVQSTQIVEITDVIESMEATPIIETVELTQIVETTDVIESMEATQTVETVELTQIVETTDVIESMEATQTVETVELTQIVETTDVIESMEATQTVETVELTQIVETTDVIESMEATQTVETVELTQIVETTDVIESMEATQTVETVELTQIVETTDVIASMEATQTVETTDVIESMEATQTVETVELTQIVETTDVIESMEAAEMIETTDVIETTKTIKNSDSIFTGFNTSSKPAKNKSDKKTKMQKESRRKNRRVTN